MSEPSSYRKFADAILLRLRDLGATFQSSDDFFKPMLIIQHPEGLSVFNPAKLLMNGEQLAMLTMAHVLRENKALRCAYVQSMMATPEPDQDGFDPENVSGYEVLDVYVIDRERVEGCSARVQRSEDAPPKLGPWVNYGPDQSEGLLITLLQNALR